MKPVDHVTPTLPANWVRRPDDRRRKKDPQGREKPPGRTSDDAPRHPPVPDADGRTHIIDDLA